MTMAVVGTTVVGVTTEEGVTKKRMGCVGDDLLMN